MHSKVVIIGSGPAGYTAAIYAARAMLEPVMINGTQPGGQLTITTDVENYPGFADVIQGPWLMEQMKAQAEHVGTRIVNDLITEVDFDRRPFTLKGDSGTTYTADAVIIATGAQARWLGLESEKTLAGRGVSACATCDGFFFRGKAVAVVGGGDTAMEEALFLTRYATKVTVIHRRSELRASKIMQERALAHEKIEFIWDSVVEEVLGEDFVSGVRVKNVKTGASQEVPVEAVFVAIGHKPNTDLLRGQLAVDGVGYLKVEPGTTRTGVEPPAVASRSIVCRKPWPCAANSQLVRNTSARPPAASTACSPASFDAP